MVKPPKGNSRCSAAFSLWAPNPVPGSARKEVRLTAIQDGTSRDPGLETQHLAVLTMDLDCDSQLAVTFPMLKRLLSEHEGGNPSVTAMRRGWFRRLHGNKLSPEMINFWKRNAARLVPEPEHSAGDYSDCADWLAALHILDSASYKKILKAWKLKHRRRRNLWKALEHAKVPLL